MDKSTQTGFHDFIFMAAWSWHQQKQQQQQQQHQQKQQQQQQEIKMQKVASKEELNNPFSTVAALKNY